MSHGACLELVADPYDEVVVTDGNQADTIEWDGGR